MFLKYKTTQHYTNGCSVEIVRSRKLSQIAFYSKHMDCTNTFYCANNNVDGEIEKLVARKGWELVRSEGEVV